MVEGEPFHIDNHYLDGSEELGVKNVVGYGYQGRFGPLYVALVQERTAATLRGGQVGEGWLAWGPEARSIQVLRRGGVEGTVADIPVRVRWDQGFRRSQNLITVELQGRPSRVMRLRGWKTWSLETTEEVALGELNGSWRWVWKGNTFPAADSNDVAILVLLATTEMIYQIGTAGPPSL